jgi:ribonuclease D
MFLGIRETGLEAVVKARFDVHLDKRFQKKDWSRRPLPPEMVEYAVKDAVWLVPLAQKIESELITMGRLEWVQEECELLSRVRPVARNEGPLFLKFRGAGQMQGRHLAVLEALLALRLQIAEKKDRPMFKVFSNSALKKIALRRPRNLQELSAIGALSGKQLSMYAKPLMAAISEALDLPAERLPRYPRRRSRPAAPGIPERVQALKTWRDRRAQALNIDPALVGNKTLLTAVAAKNPLRVEDLEPIEEMRAWQRKTFGPEIIATLKRVVPAGRSRRRRRSRRN